MMKKYTSQYTVQRNVGLRIETEKIYLKVIFGYRFQNAISLIMYKSSLI